MKGKLVVLAALLFVFGCMSDTGKVYLDTSPEQATVWLNNQAIGETPIEFNFTYDEPMIMEITRDGYYPISERLDAYWVHMEMVKGTYGEYRDTKEDGTKSRLYWKVTTTRTLHKAPE